MVGTGGRDPWWKGGRRPEAPYDGGWRRADVAPRPPLRQQRRIPAARGVRRPAPRTCGPPPRRRRGGRALPRRHDVAVPRHSRRQRLLRGLAGEVAVHAAGLVDAAPRALAMVRGRDDASEGVAGDVAAATASKCLHIQAAALLVMEEREACCGRAAGGAGGRGRGGRAGGRGHGG
jgi:hypothetical protein